MTEDEYEVEGETMGKVEEGAASGLQTYEASSATSKQTWLFLCLDP
jgi:hypothetical protein